MPIDILPKGVSVILTRRERHLLLHDTVAVPPHILDQIEAAPWEGESVRVGLSLDDLEDLIAGVAAEANHATSKRRESSLLDLYHRLAAILEEAVGIDRPGSDAYAIRELYRAFIGLLSEADVDQDLVRETMARRIDLLNQRSLPELGGLSPDQAFLLNSCGWWADPFPIRLASNLSLEQVGQTQFFHNVRAFLQAVQESDGAPATAKGNLSRAFVEHMLDLLSLRPGYLETMREVCKVINESDIQDLHIVRVIAEIGGLVRRRKKRFVVTRKARELLQEDRAGALYHHLFDTMFREFNLDYSTHLPEMPGIQATIPYELYRIGQMPLGQDHDIQSLVPVVFVEAVREEIVAVSSHVDTAQWLLKQLLLQPLESFGLVEIVAGERKPPSVSLKTAVRRLPLFDSFISFHL